MTTPSLANKIVLAIESVIGDNRPAVPHEPEFHELEKKFVLDCVESGWVSSVGEYVDLFEQKLVEYTGISHAVATINGTSALHAGLYALGISSEHEVLVPALTFVGTVNPISFLGATPHFVDCHEKNLGIDPEKLNLYLESIAVLKHGKCINRRTGRIISAMIVVHVLGIPASIVKLSEIATKWHITLIEDAAESLGSWSNQMHTGSWGKFSTLSFNGNKVITTGGGGAILTNDAELAKRLKHLTTTAKQPHAWLFSHDETAFNYRLPNINAALGCAQLEQLQYFLDKKHRLHVLYHQAFSKMKNLIFLQQEDHLICNHWLNHIRVKDSEMRDAVLEIARKRDIHLRPLWTPINQLPMYRSMPKADLTATQKAFQQVICLPSSSRLIQ